MDQSATQPRTAGARVAQRSEPSTVTALRNWKSDLPSRPFHDQKSVATLKKLRLDVGLHKAGVIYRDVTIDSFRLGILNHHIGILPAYRGRSVLEWSILQGHPVGVTVFFIDAGIDTGARILISEEVDVSGCKSVAAAKQYLFDLDRVFFPKALALLSESSPSFQLNDGTGSRYFVMSKLFEGVVDRLLQANEAQPLSGGADMSQVRHECRSPRQ